MRSISSSLWRFNDNGRYEYRDRKHRCELEWGYKGVWVYFLLVWLGSLKVYIQTDERELPQCSE